MVPFAYVLSLIALWLQSTTYPLLPLLPFAPFLALSCLVCRFDRVAFASFVAGLGMDLLSSDPMGLHSMTYLLASLFSYRVKNLFSAEEPIQFSLYTALFSFAATLLQICLLFLFDRRVPFCGRWWMSDWLALPFIDAVYALVWFAGPLYLFRTLRKRWMVYWLKRKNPSLT